MSLSTQRSRSTTRRTVGVAMLGTDTVKSTLGGLDWDTNGQPKIYNAAGVAILDAVADTYGPMVLKVAVASPGAATGVFSSTANPFGYDVIITSAVWDVTTQSTGAGTVDIGIGADATTSNDGIIDGLSSAAAGIFNNEDNAGTNGKSAVRWTSTTFLNVAEASGDVTALVSNLYVTCYRR